MATFCAQTLHNVPCGIPKCLADHNTKVCMPCAALGVSFANYYSHIESPKHQEGLRAMFASDAAPPPLWCSLCSTTVTGDAAWAVHVAGPVHADAAARLGYDTTKPFWPVDLSAKNAFRCPFCRKTLAPACMSLHARGAAHGVRERAAQVLAAMARGEREYGAWVSRQETGVDFGLLRADEGGQGRKMDVDIVNVSDEELRVVGARAVSPFKVDIPEEGLAIAPGKSVKVCVEFVHGDMGIFEDRVDITLQRGSQGPVIVSRKLIAVIKDPLLAMAQRLPPPASLNVQQALSEQLIERMALLSSSEAPARSESRSDADSGALSNEGPGSRSDDSMHDLKDESASVRTRCTCQHTVTYRSVGVQVC